MKAVLPKPQRCAIYTRKSTEHNLDLAFNSLDAQREACEAYIKSQAHEGWRLLPTRYDDGGLSGASLERPALQQLLAEVRQRRVDVIVVYKVDRLTRSLADFAKLVEAFDQHGVSFVSVTQSFNTTSSMGRLTLNVLLSFAQFEREVIGERVRDKIAASKRKGLWVGGPVPLGYKSVAKTLAVVEEDAETVRSIFRRYLALGSLGLLVEDLHRSGIQPKPRIGRDSVATGPRRFTLGPLAHILKNRFYIGEVVYRGEVHKGQHQAIVDRELFEAVQARLRESAVVRKVRRSRSPSFLSGLLFDDRGNAMSPSHANKKGVRYRYYVSQALLQNRKSEVGSVVRVAAPDLEEMIVAAIRHEAAGLCQDNEADGLSLSHLGDRELVVRRVERIVLRPRHVDITLRTPGCQAPASADSAQDLPSAPPSDPPRLRLPWAPKSTRGRKGTALLPSALDTLDPDATDALLIAIARARRWMDDIISGRVHSFAEIAQSENKVERHVRNLALLAFVSPRIVEAAANGSLPAAPAVTTLARALPHAWADQERQVGVP